MGSLLLGVGDEVEVFGRPRRISGLTEGLTSIACTSVFLPAADFTSAAGAGLNYLLVGTAVGTDPDDVAVALQQALPGVTVQTRDGFRAGEAALVRDMYGDVFATMQLIGFLIALVLVSLTLSQITSAKAREYGVTAALGATRRHLALVVATQAVWAVVAAMVVATGLALVTGRVLDTAVPNLEVVIDARDVARTLAGALIVGAPAALAPLRRVLAVDPASAFRGG